MTTTKFRVLIYAGAWFSAHTLTMVILLGFPGHRIYAALNAWWLCFYAAALLEIDIWSGFLGAAVVASVFVLSALFGIDPLYLGTGSVSSPMLLFTAAAAIVVVASPAVLNYAISRVVNLYRQTRVGRS